MSDSQTTSQLSNVGRQEALEWCDQNMHCSYPVSEDSSCVDVHGIYLPSSFLVDLQLIVPNLGMDNLEDRFFISSVVRGDSTLKVVLSLYTTNTSYVCAESALIPLDTRSEQSVASRTFSLIPTGDALTAYPQLSQLRGRLVIGSCIDMQAVGSLQFEYLNARIVSLRVFVTDSGLDHVTVVGSNGSTHTLYNDFTLQAEDGVEFDVDIDPTTNESTVRVSLRSDTDINVISQYNTIEDIVVEVIRQLGDPIRSINGITPDEDGDIQIQPGDCVSIIKSTGGLTISNSCSKPCCTTEGSTDVSQALTVLDQARERLENYYSALSTNINSIQARLASLITANH